MVIINDENLSGLFNIIIDGINTVMDGNAYHKK